VAGWRIVRGKGEGLGKRVGEKGQNKLLVRGAMDVITGEGGRVKGIRVGMRGW
jgi:hypothetical protein